MLSACQEEAETQGVAAGRLPESEASVACCRNSLVVFVDLLYDGSEAVVHEVPAAAVGGCRVVGCPSSSFDVAGEGSCPQRQDLSLREDHWESTEHTERDAPVRGEAVDAAPEVVCTGLAHGGDGLRGDDEPNWEEVLGDG